MSPMRIGVYDTRSYDREFLTEAAEGKALEFLFHEFRFSKETAMTASGMDAICVFVNDHLDCLTLEALKEMGVRLVVLRCAGFNQIDLEAAGALGIRVIRVPSYSPHAVAEHAVALLLTLNRKIHRAHNRIRENNFTLGGLVGFDLYQKTVGVIGTGKIGKVAAQIFKGFGMNVQAYDPKPSSEWAQNADVTYVRLEDLYRTCDVISLHLPLTPESHHLIDEHSLGLMKEGVYLVNTSRGKLVDTAALIRSLKSGKMGGVALDVYEEEEGIFFEDLSDKILVDDDLSRLMTFPQVLITSHQAFLTREALLEISRVTVENLMRFRSNQPFLDDTEIKSQGSK